MSVDGLSRLLLVVRNGFEEAVEVLVDTVIVALKVLKATGQIHTQSWGVVPFQRRVIQAKLVVFVVGKVGEFLRAVVSPTWSSHLSFVGPTFGRLTASLWPPNRLIGWMGNVVAMVAELKEAMKLARRSLVWSLAGLVNKDS